MKITKRILLIILCFSLPVFISGCGTQNFSKEVSGGTVGNQVVNCSASVSGILDAENSAAISSQIAGTVASIDLKEGQEVHQGDTIISLDKTDLALQLELAQANYQKSVESANQAKISYDDAKKAYDRYAQLYQMGAVSQQDFEQITSKYNLAKSQYDTAQGPGLTSAQNSIQIIQSSLSKADIKSPFDGVIASCSVSLGESVTANTPIVSVVSNDSLILNGNISESMVNYLNIGQQAAVYTDSAPGNLYNGSITFISPVSVSTGQFFPVKIQVLNSNNSLKIGMTGSASIKFTVNAPLAVSNTSLFKENGSDCVYLIQDGKAVKTPVKLGLKGDEYTIVLSGLNAGDQYIMSEPLKILDGDSVSISQ